MFLLHGTFFILVMIVIGKIGIKPNVPLVTALVFAYLMWITMVYVLSYLFYTKFELKVMNMRSTIIKKLKLEA
jgi:hypothetical protein